MNDHDHARAQALAAGVPHHDESGSRLAAPAKEGTFGGDLADAVQWGIVGLALLMLLVYRLPGGYQESISEVVRIFLSIVLEAMPFMLIGSLVGGLIEVFVSRERLAALLAGRRKRTVLIAAAMGLVFPVCECAIVPVVRRLLRKGIPVSAAVAYLLAGPIVNPIVAASTLVAYRNNWPMVPIRLGLGYAIAVGIGLLIGRLFKNTSSLLAEGAIGGEPHSHDHGQNCCDEPAHDHEHEDDDDREETCGTAALGCDSPARGGRDRPGGGPIHTRGGCATSKLRCNARPLRSRLAEAFGHAADDFMDIGRFLVIGALVAGCLRGALNQSVFISVTSNPAVAIPAMMAFAFMLTLCSEADAFVAASFQNVVPVSAQIAFLVLGPMLDVKLLLMYTKLFRKRALAVLTVAILLAVLLAATACRLALGEK